MPDIIFSYDSVFIVRINKTPTMMARLIEIIYIHHNITSWTRLVSYVWHKIHVHDIVLNVWLYWHRLLGHAYHQYEMVYVLLQRLPTQLILVEWDDRIGHTINDSWYTSCFKELSCEIQVGEARQDSNLRMLTSHPHLYSTWWLAWFNFSCRRGMDASFASVPQHRNICRLTRHPRRRSLKLS